MYYVAAFTFDDLNQRDLTRRRRRRLLPSKLASSFLCFLAWSSYKVSAKFEKSYFLDF